MMKLFSLEMDYSERSAGRIDGHHKWSLPGVTCPFCGSSWSSAGLEYPGIDLGTLRDEHLYRKARNEPLNVYLSLGQQITKEFPELTILKPGTLFGPIVGKTVGRVEGFIWQTSWTVCLERTAMEKLNESDLSLPISVKVEQTPNVETREVYEFHLPLKGHLINGVYDGLQRVYCTACGRDSASLPNQIQIAITSIPSDFDIFRVTNFNTLVLVTERFVETVRKLKIRGACFQEVGLL